MGGVNIIQKTSFHFVCSKTQCCCKNSFLWRCEKVIINFGLVSSPSPLCHPLLSVHEKRLPSSMKVNLKPSRGASCRFEQNNINSNNKNKKMNRSTDENTSNRRHQPNPSSSPSRQNNFTWHSDQDKPLRKRMISRM